MSYRGPKVKLSRALGVALTTKAATVMTKRPNPPGQHGGRRRGSKSNYGEQLLEKQRLRFQYNLSEKQLRRYFQMAKKRTGNTADALVKILESRLDIVVYRAGFAHTIYAARQLVTHGHIIVDGKRVNKPGFLLSSDHTITLKEKTKANPVVQDSLSKAIVPTYIDRNRDTLEAKFAREPEVTEAPIICRVPMVVEFYSR